MAVEILEVEVQETAHKAEMLFIISDILRDSWRVVFASCGFEGEEEGWSEHLLTSAHLIPSGGWQCHDYRE